MSSWPAFFFWQHAAAAAVWRAETSKRKHHPYILNGPSLVYIVWTPIYDTALLLQKVRGSFLVLAEEKLFFYRRQVSVRIFLFRYIP
jgi:hypothetical protein